MQQFDPNKYGPLFAPLLATDRRRALDEGSPDMAARADLERLTIDAAFAHAKVVDRDMAACCVSAVWLLHDFLDESHRISQEIETPSGSFWHAIMHRREGDYSNAKYWFRRVGRHPVFEPLGERADELRRTAEGINSPFDPFAFVDLCQAAARHNDPSAELCRDIQQAEWELLFDFCYVAAIRH